MQPSHIHATLLTQLVWWLTLGCCLITSTVNLSANERPNILLILADNWRWPNASILGDPLAQTPTFDRIAREGVLFTHTFNPVPSCSPTRSCLLTGKYAHQLGERASLWSSFPQDTPVFTQILNQAGYALGYAGKAWGPGDFAASGWHENPVGPKFTNFDQFLTARKPEQPFFFWLGNTDTATKAGRLPYLDDAKVALNAEALSIPPELPDCAELRDDLMNYYGGVLKLDQEAARAIAALEKAGLLENSLIIYASDNGWQLPRGLANCYDSGSRVPLAIRWGKQLKAGKTVDSFINLAQLGPTILDVAGIQPPREMTFNSIKGILLDQPGAHHNDCVFIERERHANVRRDNLSYPIRGVRTKDFLYLRNLRPDRWPAGDPDVLFLHGRPFGDVDTTRTKDFLLAHQHDQQIAPFTKRIFDKRPAEELYDLRSDPHQLNNVASQRGYATDIVALRKRVDDWMHQTMDPRIDPEYDAWDKYPYYGKAPTAP